jgi:large subunit ribosomal protein L1
MVRGTTALPHGTGKSVRVVAICKGDSARAAREAGADHVGDSDIISKIQGGWLDFEQVVTTPDMMKDVSRLGKILGPRGMMPNPKAGTLGEDIARIIKAIKGGKVEFKMDKTGNIHEVIGKNSFSVEQIYENAASMLKALSDARPTGVKGQLFKRITLSKSMSPGVRVASGELEKR